MFLKELSVLSRFTPAKDVVKMEPLRTPRTAPKKSPQRISAMAASAAAVEKSPIEGRPAWTNDFVPKAAHSHKKKTLSGTPFPDRVMTAPINQLRGQQIDEKKENVG